MITDCPVPTPVSREVQAQAAAELQSLPPGSGLEKLLAASLDDRDKLRACRKIR